MYYSRMNLHLLMVALLVQPKLMLRVHAQGDQIYTCQQNAYTFSWGLKAPDARLIDDSNRVIGRHFAGPTWQLNDGSEVEGRILMKVDGAEPNAIPWLEIVAVRTVHGRLEGVKRIRRWNTHGGQAPAGGCDQAHLGTDLRVPYTAEYDFYSE